VRSYEIKVSISHNQELYPKTMVTELTYLRSTNVLVAGLVTPKEVTAGNNRALKKIPVFILLRVLNSIDVFTYLYYEKLGSVG
jgi:hypothetical protein